MDLFRVTRDSAILLLSIVRKAHWKINRISPLMLASKPAGVPRHMRTYPCKILKLFFKTAIRPPVVRINLLKLKIIRMTFPQDHHMQIHRVIINRRSTLMFIIRTATTVSQARFLVTATTKTLSSAIIIKKAAITSMEQEITWRTIPKARYPRTERFDWTERKSNHKRRKTETRVSTKTSYYRRRGIIRIIPCQRKTASCQTRAKW